MPDIIPASKSTKESLHLSAQEVLNAPWHELNDGTQRALTVQDMSDEQITLTKDALSHHGLHTNIEKTDGETFLVVSMTAVKHQRAFQALANNPADFMGGVSGYGLGPDPKMADLDVHAAAFAQRALEEANLHNDDAGKIERGITQEQAGTLMEWIIQRARNDFFKDDKRSMSTASQMMGVCGYMQGMVGHQAEMLGIETHYHQVGKQSENSVMRHAFNVLEIPIEDNGTVQLKPFLVDASFRQFFQEDIVQFASSENDNLITPTWGARLVETPEGRDLADAVLQDGYAPITQQTARLYVEAQIFDKHPVTKDFHYGEWKTNSPLRALKQSTTENDYDMEEFVEWDVDIRTPQMVLDDMPLTVMLDAANDDNLDAPTASSALDM